MRKEWFETWFDSPYYHILYRDRDYKEAEKFISNLLERIQLPSGTKCLDLACGNGRHSIFLNKFGLDVTGVDLSPQNIQIAKSFENETLHFDVHDMREVYKPNAFDVVFNFFTSFGYFDDFNENNTVLKSIHQMLRENGQLIIDFMNPQFVKNNLVVKEVKIIDNIEFHLRRYIDNQFIIKQIEFEDQGEKHEFYEKVQAISYTDFKKMLKESGFIIKDVWGDFNLSPFDENTSERLILLTEKY